MTGRCLTCKHWLRVCPHGYPQNERCYRCSVAGASGAVDNRRGYCMKADSSDGEPEVEGTLMWGIDGSEYKAGVYTRPEFGCVMHEEREG